MTWEGSGSSQSSLCSHNSCKSAFARIMTGAKKPSGSNILATSERMRRFVSIELLIGFVENEKLSLREFHCNPRILVLQSSNAMYELLVRTS